jgi:hypothetical protein
MEVISQRSLRQRALCLVRLSQATALPILKPPWHHLRLLAYLHQEVLLNSPWMSSIIVLPHLAL